MGKKRRYIQRAKKFGKKAFNFLDKLDGDQDSNLKDTRLDTVITKVEVVDRGNRTYSIQVQAQGPGGDPSNDALQNDTVKLTVNGAAIHANNFLVFGAAAGGKNNRASLVTNKPAPAPADANASAGVKLDAGTNTIVAQIMKEDKSTPLGDPKTVAVNLAEPKLDLSMFTAAENGAAAGQILVKWAVTNPDKAAANTAGVANEAAGRLPGEQTFVLGTSDGSTKNDLLIVVKDKDGNAQTITDPGGAGGTHNVSGGTNVITLGDAAGLGTGITIQRAGGDFSNANAPYTVTITPRDKAAAAHTPSAVTITGINIAE